MNPDPSTNSKRKDNFYWETATRRLEPTLHWRELDMHKKQISHRHARLTYHALLE